MGTLIYFLIFGAAFYLMMRFGCGAHVMGHSPMNAEPRPASSAANSKLRGYPGLPENTVDPVCGMNVSTASAKPSIYGESAYYFCSAECRDRFESSPQSYLPPTNADLSA